jgi:DUF4097 and DUF4098 domain-containing protein YvlB
MANGITYRRGSVFGALLLIAVGALFLYANLTPEFSAWPIIATYWPVLIIFWGLGKLVDYLILRGRPEAVAVARLTAGDIIGLILLLGVGSFLSTSYKQGWWKGGGIRLGGDEIHCLMGNQYNFTDEVKQATTSPTTLILENARGDLSLASTPEGEIQLTARKTVCAGSETEARSLADRMEPVLESTGEGYRFRWEMPGGSTGLLTADLEGQVPEATRLRLVARRGDVRVSGTRGDLDLTVERGDVHLENIHAEATLNLRRGSAHLSSITGTVRVEGQGDEISFRDIGQGASLRGEFYGPLQFSNIAGPVEFVSRRTDLSAAKIEGEMTIDSGELHLRGVPGDVRLVTRGKDIEIEDARGEIHIENRDGPVVIRYHTPPVANIYVGTRSADIELYLPSQSDFIIDATVRSGDIESDFTGPNLSLEKPHGGDEVLKGSYGGAGRRPSIQLSTTHGSITLRQATSR